MNKKITPEEALQTFEGMRSSETAETLSAAMGVPVNAILKAMRPAVRDRVVSVSVKDDVVRYRMLRRRSGQGATA
jgi:hypothetical protein